MDSSFSHVALLVTSVEASARYLNSHGIQTNEPATFESEGTREIYAGTYEKQRGLLLLLEAIADGPYRRALNKRGPSIHHIAVDVVEIEAFLLRAEAVGWKQHEITAKTMSHKTAWLYSKGIPTLIEVSQKKELSIKPFQVSKVELPIQKNHQALFKAIGLAEIVSCEQDSLHFTVDGQRLPFVDIAGSHFI